MAQRNLYIPNTPIGTGGGSGYGLGDYSVTIQFTSDVEIDSIYFAYYEYAGTPTFEAYIKDPVDATELGRSSQVAGHGKPNQQWLEIPFPKTKLLANKEYELHFVNTVANFARNDNPSLPITFEDEIYGLSVTHTIGWFWWGMSVKPSIEKKVLFEDGTEIKKFNASTNAWEIVGSSPATEDMFLTNGMTNDELLAIPSNSINSLTNENLRVLVHTETIPTYQMKFKINGVPQNKLVLANGDIDITSVDKINQIKVESWVYSWNAFLKNIVSFDEGVSWYAWNGTEWVQVDVSNMADVNAKAMTNHVMANLSVDNWSSIRGNSNTLRLGYLLGMENVTDYVKADTLVTNFDMKGIWKVYKNADVEYPSNNSIRILLYENGDYKINY